MLQILGLREFFPKDAKTGERSKEPKLYDAFLEKGWRAPSIFELFENLDSYLENIPSEERWNLFYTVANCTQEKRQFASQDVLPIDIDGIDEGTEGAVVDVICTELKLDPTKVGIVYSGNGVHILVGLKKPITEASFLRTQKAYYKALAGRVNTALFHAGVKGSADTTVFSEARILRLPSTKNVKKNRPVKDCVLVNGKIERLDVDLYSLADMPEVGEGEHVHPNAYRRMPAPDSEAVQTKCGFIAHCREKQGDVSEPMWYAMLSIVARLDHGEALAHEYSKGHEGYDPLKTQDKIEHALQASGPRTCSNISTMYAGCATCPHSLGIVSPIQLIGEDTIRTKATGFYNIKVKSTGEVTQGKPNYDDLEKFFRKNYKYSTYVDTGAIFIRKETHWEEITRLEIHKFAEDCFRPTPTNNMCTEFEHKLRRNNHVGKEFFSVDDRLNFKNGILSRETGGMEPHREDIGFTYTIPYDFKPKGDCPVFKKFMKDVTLGDDALANLIVEYMGFCLSTAHPKLVQKCAILYGDGSNGKSVLLDLMRSMVGPKNWCSVSADGLSKETNRFQLMYKMFNVSDETPKDAFLESSTFKAIVSGDVVPVRRLYGDPFDWECTTKLMFACNELPFSGDFTNGMYRRLLIIPFNNTFSDEIGNKDALIGDKLKEEMSDIFLYCIEGFKRLQNRGYKFEDVAAVKEQLEDYAEVGDSVKRFFAAQCVFEEGKVISTENMYKLFVFWCQDNFVKPITFSVFSRRIGKLISVYMRGVRRSRKTATSGVKQTLYTNITVEAVTRF